MRLVSLSPGATEILYHLGCGIKVPVEQITKRKDWENITAENKVFVIDDSLLNVDKD